MRLSVLRIVPIFLSFFTVLFTGILAKKIFSPTVGIIAASLYAFTPTIVLSNRLSLTENLLTPVVLITLILFWANMKNKLIQSIMVGFGSGLALLTKDIGIVLVLTLLILCIVEKKWRVLIIMSFVSLVAFITHPAIGYYYDWQLFIRVISNYHQEFSSAGPPGLIATIFLHPIIERKGYPFPDGAMLLGYLIFFTSPFWIKEPKDLNSTVNRLSIFWFKFMNRVSVVFKSKERAFILFPFIYITILALLSSGSNFSFYGWHVYPLFPFLMILLAQVLYKFWKQADLLQSLVFFLILGSSSIRFLVLLNPQFQKFWQLMLAILLLFLINNFLPNKYHQKIILFILFVIFLVTNILVVVNLEKIYPSISQPVDNYSL
ncbi:hypothetical protein A2164_04150 [Candidatus Curtissbacteria bacterium RBG_13_35_7]|uniref:Glycosyltransferase RgtA/B/C/D-like domain-containing protein n=1 Tax=Candidatus Curtissbacteria bacterium RBG_13_35_7 TaxID=1797705 RepID=A0A1F5G159_9BACT|nr:MAG: hypothetical protein A2164_04150 [Candidatus Curtissbacteria bacterium RBG_13_35_7]